MSPDETYRRAKARTRRQPSWLLRRNEARIVAARPRPSDPQLAELAAIRTELRIRSIRKAPLNWWSLW